MKYALISAILIAMSSTAQANSIETFKRLCLSNAGNPSAIIAAGERAGFAMTELGKDSAMGFRRSTDESLQVNAFTNHSFECAVTTSDMNNPAAVSEQFFQALGLTPRRGMARGKIAGTTYTFIHDTNGGEAFVMYEK